MRIMLEAGRHPHISTKPESMTLTLDENVANARPDEVPVDRRKGGKEGMCGDNPLNLMREDAPAAFALLARAI